MERCNTAQTSANLITTCNNNLSWNLAMAELRYSMALTLAKERARARFQTAETEETKKFEFQSTTPLFIWQEFHLQMLQLFHFAEMMQTLSFQLQPARLFQQVITPA